MREMIARHWEVAKEAYKQQKLHEVEQRMYSEQDFLPAALEILETPASPAGRTTLWVILSFFTIALLWAIFGRIDIVASAQGKIMPVGYTKVIQPAELGVVRDILVENGDSVKAGDVLVELDPTYSGADVGRLKREYLVSQLGKARYQWLLAKLQKQPIQFSWPPQAQQESINVQTLLANSQWLEYTSTQSALEQTKEEKRSEYNTVKRELVKLKETIPLIEEQAEGVLALSDKGMAPRFQYLEYKERLVNSIQDLAIAKDRLLQVTASIKTIEKQIEQHQQEFGKEVVSGLADASDKAVALRHDLNKAERRERLHKLRAPVDGVVQQLAIFTRGGVVQAGEALMVIVPNNKQLEVEAMVLNKDIGFVEQDQIVEVKLEAFSFTKYGVIDGHVKHLAQDSVQDEMLGLVYPVRVAIDKQTILVKGNPVALGPGMSATVEIKIGQRRVIEFLLAPLLRYKNESLREQ
jgi:hemolysin D